MKMAKVCLDGELEIKQAVAKDRAYWINNYIADATRFLKRLLPLVAMLLLGYYFGKANIEPITVTCEVKSDVIYLPNSLQRTGSEK